MSKNVRIVLCGLGNVGKALVALLAERRNELESRYGLRLDLAAAVDINGAAIAGDRPMIPAPELSAHLQSGRPVESFENYGRPAFSGVDAIEQANACALVETTPTNLIDGEPGRTHIVAALQRGMEVISANKGPIGLLYRELHDLARENECGIHISAATAAALPTLDGGTVCLAGTSILEAEGLLNGSTNYSLCRMLDTGCLYETALEEAQQLGIAETNPSLDVEGHDTANKLILIANRLFDTSFGPKDVQIEGITKITPQQVSDAAGAGEVMKLVGRAKRTESGVELTVAPRRLKKDHPLAAVNGSEKAISYLTDTMHRVTVSGGKSSPVGAAAALLKDLINAFAK